MHRLWAKLSPFWCFQFYRWVDHSAVPSTILWSWFGITDHRHLWYHVKNPFSGQLYSYPPERFFYNLSYGILFHRKNAFAQEPTLIYGDLSWWPDTTSSLFSSSWTWWEEREERKSLIEWTTLRNFLLENTVLRNFLCDFGNTVTVRPCSMIVQDSRIARPSARIRSLFAGIA